MRTPAGKGGGKGERTRNQSSAPSHAVSPHPLEHDFIHKFNALNVENIITIPPYLRALSTEIAKHHDLATQHATTALEHDRQCGALLGEAKTAIGHGHWSTWLQQNFTGSERTAQRYMRLNRKWSEITSKRATVADIGVAAAEAIVSAPKAAPERAHESDALRSWLPKTTGLCATWETPYYLYTGLIVTVGAQVGERYAVAIVVLSKATEEGYVEGWRRGIVWDRVPYLLEKLGLPGVGHEAWESVGTTDSIFSIIDTLKGAPPMPRPFGTVG